MKIPTPAMKILAPAIIVIVLGLIIIPSSTYSLDETEQAVIVQFGAPVGQPVNNPGLHFKAPFIQQVRIFDKRLLAWDGNPNQIPTLGREFIAVDTTARWRIINPLQFLQSVKDVMGAQARLGNIIDSVVRDKVSSNELVEIVRSQGWDIKGKDVDRATVGEEKMELLRVEIEVGREELERQILEVAAEQMPKLGIELVDVRIKRLNYIPSVQKEIFGRMIAERQRIAAQFRAEGERQSTIIRGETEKRQLIIKSEAEQEAEIIHGKADAEAIRIYNEAYSVDPEFYAFQRTLESYTKSIQNDSTLIIGMDSDYFQYLRRIRPSDELD